MLLFGAEVKWLVSHGRRGTSEGGQSDRPQRECIDATNVERQPIRGAEALASVPIATTSAPCHTTQLPSISEVSLPSLNPCRSIRLPLGCQRHKRRQYHENRSEREIGRNRVDWVNYF